MFERLRVLPLDVLYLFLLTPLLLALVYIHPPLQSADEPAHFYRAVQLSHGEIMPELVNNSYRPAAGAAIDPAAIELVRRYCINIWTCTRNDRPSASTIFARQEPARNEPRESVAFSNIVIYLPIAHALPAAAMAIARGAGLSPLAWMYAGRIANTLLALAVTWLALRLLRGRSAALPVFAVATLPLVLHVEPTLSADVATISFSLLLLAICFRLLDAHRPAWLWPMLAVASPLAAAAKLAYLPLAIVPVAIAVFGRAPRQTVAGTLAIAVATIMLTAAWSLTVHAYVFPVNKNLQMDIPGQIAFLRQHPLDGARNLLMSMAAQAPQLLFELVGRERISHWLKLPWRLVLPPTLALLTAFAISGTAETRLPQRLAVLLLVAASISATFLFLYLQDTVVGAARVNGYQGRYLLPIIPFLTLALPRWTPFGQRGNELLRMLVIAANSLFAVVVTLFLWLRPN